MAPTLLWIGLGNMGRVSSIRWMSPYYMVIILTSRVGNVQKYCRKRAIKFPAVGIQ